MECVNIIGAGLAGLSAAIKLAGRGTACNLISLQTSERAQSVLAEGGINAALDTMGEGDHWREHYIDTMRGGADLADGYAVENLTRHAPEIVQWLVNLGAPLENENGRLILRNFGGQKKKRTAYAKSSTGKIIMTALIDKAREYEDSGYIARFSHHELMDFNIMPGNGGQGNRKYCAGVMIRDIWTGKYLDLTGPVILASGGLNGLFPGQTTGSVWNTGNAAAIAFSYGIEFGNLEFSQYHPTTVQIPGKRLLISEAARGEGGRLYITRNGAKYYFMEESYPEWGNLAPRDIISREMEKSRLNGYGPVYLDMTGLDDEIWKRKLDDLRKELKYYLNIDPAKEAIQVSPRIHFFMGGILVNQKHCTNMNGLYAAGECACQYHGANRLGGNSMLAALYGGSVAADSALEFDNNHSRDGNTRKTDRDGKETESDEKKYIGYIESAAETACISKLGEILRSGLGIIRDEITIRAALDRIDNLLNKYFDNRRDDINNNINKNNILRYKILLGKAMLSSALERRESRGAHFRTDFPSRDDTRFRKTTVARLKNQDGGGNDKSVKNERIEIEFREIPERGTENDGGAG